jgi:hypothetical protein
MYFNFAILNYQISIDELVYSFVDDKMDKSEFIKQYEVLRGMTRVIYRAIDANISEELTVGSEEFWKQLELKGCLSQNDYETFDLKKFNMDFATGVSKFLTNLEN